MKKLSEDIYLSYIRDLIEWELSKYDTQEEKLHFLEGVNKHLEAIIQFNREGLTFFNPIYNLIYKYHIKVDGENRLYFKTANKEGVDQIVKNTLKIRNCIKRRKKWVVIIDSIEKLLFETLFSTGKINDKKAVVEDLKDLKVKCDLEIQKILGE